MRYVWLFRAVAWRLGRLFVLIILALFFTFLLARLSPFQAIPTLPTVQTVSPTVINAQVDYYYGLYPNDPIPIQFVTYIWGVLQGQLGHSLITNLPVARVVQEALPWTLLLVVSSTLISFGLGTFIGMLIAYKRGNKVDNAATVLLTILYSVPVYVVALLLLIALSFNLNAFPRAGAYDIFLVPGLSLAFLLSVLYHAALPILTLVLVNFGGWALGMRANTLMVMGEDYVYAAEARGIQPRRIAIRYVGRNAILPQFTNLVIALGFAFTGSVFVENVFTYPGIGYLLISAINVNDYPVIMGVFITFVIAVLVGLALADLLYVFLDPRVRR